MKNQVAMLERAGNIFYSHWEEMLRLRRVVMKGGGQEDIHDLRVSSRRFRAAFALLEPLTHHSAGRAVVRRVRRITRTLGTLRNIDEALAFFTTHGSGENELSTLLTWLPRSRKKEQRKVLDKLKAFRPRKFDPLVREMVAGLSMESLHDDTQPQFSAYLSNTSLRLFSAINTLLPEAMVAANTAERHALRIAIKKWRYFNEIVARIVEQDYGPFLERLRAYQSLLGSMNDMTAFAILCREAALPPAQLAAVEQLLHQEHDRLWGEFVDLAAREPLVYTFRI